MAADSRCGSFAAFVLAGLLAGCERRAETFASPDAEVLAVEHPVRMPGPERPMPGDLAARLGPADASRLAEAGGLNAAGGRR